MFAPQGYHLFHELAELTWDISTDLCWAVRSKIEDGAIVTSMARQERSAVQCWLMAKLLSDGIVCVCSSTGVVMRAPTVMAMHQDQLEMLPCPLPIEKSSIDRPEVSEELLLDDRSHFNNRFVFFNWATGQIRRVDEIERLDSDKSGFSPKMQKQLAERHALLADAFDEYAGWSICLDKTELSDDDEMKFLSAFGVDQRLIDKVNDGSPLPFKLEQTEKRGRPRIRDDAMEAYWKIYPDGHEIAGITLKEATNSVSGLMGRPISDDTLRRAIGKKP